MPQEMSTSGPGWEHDDGEELGDDMDRTDKEHEE